MRRPAVEQLQQTLATNLRRLRESRGLTQEQTAEAIGIAWRHLQKLEAGEVNVTIRTLARICDGLGVDVPTLFTSSAPTTRARRSAPRRRRSHSRSTNE